MTQSVILQRTCAAMVWIALALGGGAARGATFAVTNLNDSGPGSFRQAIKDANIVPGASTISFAAGLTGTIVLTSGQIEILGNLLIAGPGAGKLVISGNRNSRILHVGPGATATIRDVGLENGNAGSGGGGAIYSVGGTVLVSNCVVRGNAEGTGQSGFGGGGIANDGGSLTISQTTIAGNTAWNGGGVFNVNGGTLLLIDSTLSGNSALVTYASRGGGLANMARGRAAIVNSTLDGNASRSGGGISNEGGISNDDSSTMTIVNSTITRNRAETLGGGIGAGVYDFGPPRLRNSLVAENVAPTGGQCSAPVIDDGHNLDSGTTCGLNSGKGSLSNVAPLLGPLAENGGPTQTVRLYAGSPAINAGDNALVPAGVTTDQRGLARIQDGTVDIGAVEFEFVIGSAAAGMPGIPALDGWSVLMLALLVGAMGLLRLERNIRSWEAEDTKTSRAG